MTNFTKFLGEKNSYFIFFLLFIIITTIFLLEKYQQLKNNPINHKHFIGKWTCKDKTSLTQMKLEFMDERIGKISFVIDKHIDSQVSNSWFYGPSNSTLRINSNELEPLIVKNDFFITTIEENSFEIYKQETCVFSKENNCQTHSYYNKDKQECCLENKAVFYCLKN